VKLLQPLFGKGPRQAVMIHVIVEVVRNTSIATEKLLNF